MHIGEFSACQSMSADLSASIHSALLIFQYDLQCLRSVILLSTHFCIEFLIAKMFWNEKLPWRPELNPVHVHVGYLTDRIAVGQISVCPLPVLVLSCLIHVSYQMLIQTPA
jgi:hypothetical protein